MVELGEGVGFGDLLDGLGDGDGDAGLDELSVGEDEPLDGDFAFEIEALGVDDGLLLAEWLELGETLGEADSLLLVLAVPLGEADLLLLMLAEPAGEADALLRRDLLGDAEADADSLDL